jgi:hypothetical protein
MRKVLYFAATIAALFATGCSSDEVVESASKAQKAITFENAFIDKSTRSTTAEDPSITVATLGSFKVYGYQDTNLLFNGQEVTDNKESDDADPVWVYSPLKYWVTGASYNFVGVANAGNATVATTLSDGSITTTITSFASDGETDLLASAEADVESATQTDTPVGLTFKHLLSKVKFTFTNGFGSDDDATLVVKDVKIKNPYATGTVTVKGTTPTISWESQAEAETSTALEFGKTDEIAPNSSDEASYAKLLIPGTKEDYTVTFDVELYANATSSKSGDKFITKTYTHTVSVSSLELKSGYSYNLTATLDATNVNPDDAVKPILFTVSSIRNWTESDDKSILTTSNTNSESAEGN